MTTTAIRKPLSKQNVVWKPHPGSQEDFLSCPVHEALLHGNRGGGKGFLPEEKVMTPRGWTTMGKLKVGSVISNPDGTSQTVIAVYHRDKQQMYKLTFSDGSTIKCDGDHLWFAKVANRIKGKTIRKYMPLDFYGSVHKTEDLYKTLKENPHKRPLIPCCDPIKFQNLYSRSNYRFDPYLLGLLLGDGSLSRDMVAFSTADQELFDYVQQFGFGAIGDTANPRGERCVSPQLRKDNQLYRNLENSGLRGCTSKDKFIPKEYLWGSVETRLAVLQGLMDTDGEAHEGKAYFSSTSYQLVKDVQFLVQSLGGWATLVGGQELRYRMTDWEPREYKYTGSIGWGLYIRLPDQKNLFRLERKRDKAENYMHGRLIREIVSIKKLKKKQKTICIVVNNPNRLFVTKDFLVTHNTDALLMDFLQHVGVGYGAEWRGILFREEYTQLTDVIVKSKKWIKQIFPGAKYNGSEHKWTFPDGESLYLRYMRVPSDYWSYHGHEYPWCVLGTTEVVMWDKGVKQIQDIKVGDYVMSLEGPKRVLNVMHSRKPCVEASFFDGDSQLLGKQIQGEGHQLLSTYGMHNGLTQGSYHESAQFPQNQAPWFGYGSHLNVHQHSQQVSSHVQNLRSFLVSVLHSAKAVGYDTMLSYLCQIFLQSLAYQLLYTKSIQYPYFSLESVGNYASDIDGSISHPKGLSDVHQGLQQLALSCSLHVLRLSEQFRLETLGVASDYESHYVPFDSQVLGFLSCHFQGSHHNDVLSHQVLETYQDTVPSYASNVVPILDLHGMGGMGNAHASVPPIFYSHPYSTELRQSSLNFPSMSAACYFTPLGYDTHLVDLTVADASHYITVLNTSQVVSSTKTKCVVNKNCGWEELTNWATDECYKAMMSTNRCSDPRVPRKYRATCNPAGPGHGWVKTRFIDAADPLTIHYDKETGRGRVHIPSKLEENTTLLEADPNYETTILASAADDPIKYKAWVLGSWDIIAGGFFTDLWEPKTHVLPYFQIPSSWYCYRSFDWGSSKPWAVTYIAECNGEQPDSDEELPYFPKGSCVIFNEAYGWNGTVNEGDRATSQDIAERVLGIDRAMAKEFGVQIKPGPADINIFEVRDGLSINSSMRTNGLHWKRAYKGSGSRVSGWSLMRTMLGAATRKDPEKPHLYFCSRARHHIRTLPLMQSDEKKPEDIDSDLEDHCFVYGTDVITSNGVKKIGDLVGTEGKVLSVNGEFVNYTDCRKVKSNAALVKVTFNDGYFVVCTPDHKFLTRNGFVEAQNLLTLSDTECIVSTKGGLLCKLKSCLINSRNLVEKYTTNVGQFGEGRKALTVLKQPVQYVPVHLQQSTNHVKSVTVHVAQNYVLGVSKVEPLNSKEDVYCLVAKGTHTFTLANGVVVSNCMDSCRYGLTRKYTKMKRKKVGI